MRLPFSLLLYNIFFSAHCQTNCYPGYIKGGGNFDKMEAHVSRWPHLVAVVFFAEGKTKWKQHIEELQKQLEERGGLAGNNSPSRGGGGPGVVSVPWDLPAPAKGTPLLWSNLVAVPDASAGARRLLDGRHPEF